MDRNDRLEMLAEYLQDLVESSVDGWVIFSDADRPDNYIQLWKESEEEMSCEVSSRNWEDSELPPLSPDKIERLHQLGFSGGGPGENPERIYRPEEIKGLELILDAMFTDVLGSPQDFDLDVEEEFELSGDYSGEGDMATE